MSDSSFILKVSKGDSVFTKKEKPRYLYCIEDRVMHFSKAEEKGGEHITKLLGSGELLGRRALIMGEGAYVNAVAVRDT